MQGLAPVQKFPDMPTSRKVQPVHQSQPGMDTGVRTTDKDNKERIIVADSVCSKVKRDMEVLKKKKLTKRYTLKWVR